MWAYDWQEAMRIAKRDAWGCAKTGAEIEATVRADYESIRGWIRDDWHWCGVSVQLLDNDDEPLGGEFDYTLWGVESSGDYWLDVARDLADDILHDRAKAWRSHLHEARQVRYWASRDIVTTVQTGELKNGNRQTYIV